MRGKDRVIEYLSSAVFATGSPPRVRGKGRPLPTGRRRGRITPACAGKRRSERKTREAIRDHPRVCGEKLALPPQCHARRGSPPRVRGKGCESCDRPRSAGITPACAGKSSRPRVATARGRDHPRVCGEKAAALSQSCAGKGSPPRVRGKERNLLPLLEILGITPACAGKSSCSFPFCPYSRDHPRVCGEKSPPMNLTPQVLGSPPRVRGKVLSRPHGFVKNRITPACAGKSCKTSSRRLTDMDHPRVCGEK